jgi:hypothetical protein
MLTDWLGQDNVAKSRLVVAVVPNRRNPAENARTQPRHRISKKIAPWSATAIGANPQSSS